MQFVKPIGEWLDRYARQGEDNLSDGELSRRFAGTVGCVVGACCTPPYMLGYWLAGADLLAIVVSPLCLFLFVPILFRWGLEITLYVSVALLVSVFSVATYLTGADSGLWLFMFNGVLVSILLFSFRNLVRAVLVAGLVLAVMMLNVVLFQEPSGHLAVGPHFNLIVFVISATATFVQISNMVLALDWQVAKAEAALAAEHARSESLLRNLLPDEIATRLKNEPGEVIADGFPAVTLLFADIVDFTPRSARMSPEDLVRFLNRIFSEFDRLTNERGLEKIKTIGDAYMVAAGLPELRDDHAEVIADMALEMQATAKRLSRDINDQVSLRVGVHSGPAIAGVIGTRKVFYDVWGDTVNTASRMESHGLPGRIQITAATRALIHDQFQTSHRGLVQIKGIGTIDTWWLDGRKTAG